MSDQSSIPFEQIETLFVDVGNTLVSMDFQWICRELEARGTQSRTALLRRAEAAARPALSRQLRHHSEKDGSRLFTAYLGEVLSRLSRLGVVLSRPAAELARELSPILRPPGGTQRLWSAVLPGVEDALVALKAAGLGLAVVSNSDGSVERGLEDLGLRDYFDAVIDSHLTGYEKPDPRIFFRALQLVGATASETVHVGDIYHADVTGAHAAGLHAVLLDPFDDWIDLDCVRFPDLRSLQSAICAARGESQG
ncbi:MAG: HAD family hydrolase [Acidobacteriota bacterium]